MKNILEDNYISIEEAAVYLGIKAVTLRTWIKTKKERGRNSTILC